MDLNKKRWLILAACCLANLCLGSVYAWSVFASAMAEHLTTVLCSSGLQQLAILVLPLCVMFTLPMAFISLHSRSPAD